MVRRQTFDEFLNSPGPSNPRGRGRGRGGSGRGGATGGRGRGGGGGFGAKPRSSFTTDYTNVPLDYSRLNSKTYTKLEGYDVAPFGPESGSKASSSSAPRGRGRGRGVLGSSRAKDSDSRHTPSGARTPVTGLGYHGRGHAFPEGTHLADDPNSSRSAGRRLGDTVGKSGVMWGGGYAPIFVKAGELFKDGEVDVIKVDEESEEVSVEVEHLNDAAVPQMDHLRDDFEVEIPDLTSPQDGRGHDELRGMLHLPDVAIWATPRAVAIEDEEARSEDERVTTDAELAKGFSEVMIVEEESQVPIVASAEANMEAETTMFEVGMAQPQEPEEGTAEEAEDGLDDPFFVDVEGSHGPAETKDELYYDDTAPAQTVVVDETTILYDTAESAAPLGQRLSRSTSPEAEEILFKPRQYAQPKPIAVDVPTSISVARSEESLRASTPAPELALAQGLSRRQKKALKREKRSRKKGKAREKNKMRLQAYEGSDLDWGSDGPPVNILDVEGLESDDDNEDEAILRDYLKGTIRGHQADHAQKMDSEEDEDEVDSDLEDEITRAYDATVLAGDEDFELSSVEEENPDIEESSGSEYALGEEGEEDKHSSELDEVTFTWREEVDSEDEGDEEDEEDMFKGKDDWNDTEWFIKNLEEALDGNVDIKDRQSRNLLFSSIENGDFGDDWGTMPVKRNKNGSGIPLELQGQWEKDRQRKAEKKRQRDLERLADLIDPHPATHVRKKGKGKGASRIEQARLAHLIPESASRIVEMFDIPSDLDDPPSKSRGRLKLLPGGRVFGSIDENIRAFIADEGKQAYSVPPMDKEGRKKIHMLAECYGLSSKSRGKGKARFTVLTKTRRTGENINEDKITRLVAAAPFSGGAFYKALYSRTNKEKSKKGPGDRGSSARMRDGETVGEGAERIGMDNIGHQLLSKMGWAEGSRIGRSEGGLENPVVAIVKSTKAGLGA